MMRGAAAALVAMLAAASLTILPGPPVTWLAAFVLVVGGVGVAALSVPVVTIAAVLALIAYALALVIVQPAVDPVVAIGLGATLVVLLPLVHLAGRAQGAALGVPVVLSQLRHWLAIAAAGALAAVVLVAGAVALGAVLAGASMPVVVVVSALGALLVMVGVIALVPRRDPPRSAGGPDRR